MENARACGAQELITACPLCLYNLTENASDGLPVAYFTQLLAEKAATALVYSPQQGTNGKICIISTEYDTNKLGRHISAVLGGKGGGKPGTYQGFVEKETDEKTLLELIKSFE